MTVKPLDPPYRVVKRNGLWHILDTRNDKLVWTDFLKKGTAVKVVSKYNTDWFFRTYVGM